MSTNKETNTMKSLNNGLNDCGLDIVSYIFKSFSKSEPLPPDEEHTLGEEMKQGNNKSREKLIKANMRYVVEVAMKYTWSKTPLEDLIQAGCEGLVKAANNFDASLGCRLISFATWHIDNEIHKAAVKRMREFTILDAPYKGKKDGETKDERISESNHEHICGDCTHNADWNLRYRDMLKELMRRLDERQYGLGPLLGDLHEMLQEGHSTLDFARKHCLNEQQMKRLFAIIREEAGPHLKMAA